MNDGVPGRLAHMDVEGESLHRAARHGLHADEEEQRDQEESRNELQEAPEGVPDHRGIVPPSAPFRT